MILYNVGRSEPLSATEENGLKIFNLYVHKSILYNHDNIDLSLTQIRIMALQLIYETTNKATLNKVFEAFNHRYPHWKLENGANSYKSIKYAIHRMSNAFDIPATTPRSIKKSAIADVYYLAPVNRRSVAAFKREPKKTCTYHPDRKTNSQDLCGSCYGRMRRITEKGLVDSNTKPIVIDEILSLSMDKTKGTFLSRVYEILYKHGLITEIPKVPTKEKAKKIREKVFCRVHSDRKSVSKGLCINCATRVRVLTKKGINLSNVSENVIDKICAIPSHRGDRSLPKEALNILFQAGCVNIGT